MAKNRILNQSIQINGDVSFSPMSSEKKKNTCFESKNETTAKSIDSLMQEGAE
jgi:hypothetical protein